MKPNLCDSCNSPIIIVKKGIKVSYECSYCGKIDKGHEVGGFIPEYDGNDEWGKKFAHAERSYLTIKLVLVKKLVRIIICESINGMK